MSVVTFAQQYEVASRRVKAAQDARDCILKMAAKSGVQLSDILIHLAAERRAAPTGDLLSGHKQAGS